VRYGREIIRRDAANPNLAEGERIQVELDPEQIRRMFNAGESFLATLAQVLGRKPPARRRRRPRSRRTK
jgi:hypothetical protein